MSETFTVRAATTADIPEIVVLWREFMDFHRELDPHFSRDPLGEHAFLSFVGDNIASADWLVLVAEAGDAIVGYHMGKIETLPPIFLDRAFGNIYDLAVTASMRRRGVGSALLAALLEWYTSRGVRRIEVRYAAPNPLSNAFWRGHGFAPYMYIGTRDLPLDE